ncbi:hypothetical protein [uncultured Aquimarina sp.]|uniref:hypothetical protein n=1 Tax=uncultured Aquimarina sp. TaxID=575652 RepID=UPI002613DD96|nr:hypothetical protein [uncultured Aquimarina sp.]
MKHKYYLIVFLLLTSSYIGFSQDIIRPNQTTEVVFDYKTGKISGVLPFDKQIALIIKNHQENGIHLAQIYEVKYKNKKRQIRYRENIKDTISIKFLSEIDSILRYRKTSKKAGLITIKSEDSKEKFKLVLEDTATTPKIHQVIKFKPYQNSKTASIGYINPLKPERLYEILVVRDNPTKNLSSLFEYFHLLRKKSPDSVLEKFYKHKILTLENEKAKREFEISSFPITHKGFKEKIANEAFNYLTSLDSIPEMIHSYKGKIPLAKRIRQVGKLIEAKKLNIGAYTDLMYMFLVKDKVSIDEYIMGQKFKDTSKFDILKTKIQLNKNLKILDTIRKDLKTLRITLSDKDVNNLELKFMNSFYNLVKTNHDSISKYFETSKSIVNNQFPRLDLISAQTQTSDLKTSNSKSLIPDFGIVNAFGHNSDGDIKYIARPYFGLNWHIGGINREQQLNEIINKGFRHQFSISLGVTIGNIDTEDYEDLYNGISPTLGINYRVTRQIRLGIGTLFLREKDPNPVLDSDKIIIAPYASLSFDFDIISRAGKLLGKIGF